MKIQLQNLSQTPRTVTEKEEPPKKVYPKEKHPNATQSPKFGQRLLVAAPKEKQPAKPEPAEKPGEQKRYEVKQEVTKPVERAAIPHRKAPDPPFDRAPSKPKEKVHV